MLIWTLLGSHLPKFMGHSKIPVLIKLILKLRVTLSKIFYITDQLKITLYPIDFGWYEPKEIKIEMNIMHIQKLHNYIFFLGHYSRNLVRQTCSLHLSMYLCVLMCLYHHPFCPDIYQKI